VVRFEVALGGEGMSKSDASGLQDAKIGFELRGSKPRALEVVEWICLMYAGVGMPPKSTSRYAKEAHFMSRDRPLYLLRSVHILLLSNPGPSEFRTSDIRIVYHNFVDLYSRFVIWTTENELTFVN
jgi:hypothetical protein